LVPKVEEVFLEMTVHLVLLENRVLEVHPAHQVLEDQMVQKVQLAFLDQKETKASKDYVEDVVHLGCLEIRENEGLWVLMDLQVTKENKESLVSQDWPEKLVHGDPQESKVKLVLWDQKDQKERPVFKVLKA
jgi:hypothetical protein